MKFIFFTFGVALLMVPSISGNSLRLDLNGDRYAAVRQIAKKIRLVQPFLPEKKYAQYAAGIYRASMRYGIEPEVLISIVKQESSFRENLPEGKAGETGIAQIRKNWLNNPRFRKEFKHATIAHLHTPAWSFLFAAWILRDLKDSVSQSQTPYWTFYNSRVLKARMKYSSRVGRFLSAIETNRDFYPQFAKRNDNGKFLQLATLEIFLR